VVEIVKGNGCFVEQREGWKMAFVEPSKGRARIIDLRVRIEARQIVALLKERFGQYMADGKVEAGS
jgi:hypothetical protein